MKSIFIVFGPVGTEGCAGAVPVPVPVPVPVTVPFPVPSAVPSPAPAFSAPLSAETGSSVAWNLEFLFPNIP
ncbi:MAG: hypothetical protein E7240_04645 [Lachnospiraceae bacterium]|nr:hypothetical protein [Lachnospiraceae bacterium]